MLILMFFEIIHQIALQLTIFYSDRGGLSKRSFLGKHLEKNLAEIK